MSILTPVRQSAPEIRSSGLRALFCSAAAKAFPKNALIFSESNRSADSVYMVESGRVKLFLSNADGKEIDLCVLGPGEIFGDTELDAGPRSVSAMTVEPSKLVLVRQSDFRQSVEEDPQFAMELMLKLISRNRELLKTVKSLALMDVSDRVAQLLLEMATEENGKLIINEKVSKRNIANRVGATREMASRVFRDLVASGYIELENKKITISRRMAGLLASAAIVGLAVVLVQSGNSGTAVPDTVVASINSLPATGAGRPSLVAAAPDAARVSGALATGLVERVYVKSAEGVFVEVGRAPERLKEGRQRWAEVRFPEPVGGTTGSAFALLGDTRDEVGAGDVVDVSFAPTRDPRAATDKEEARVTGLVERKDSALAREFERRIFARSERSASYQKWPAEAGR
jgi:CRP/FNR family cyclic AMP-dependent transcriptional regulator